QVVAGVAQRGHGRSADALPGHHRPDIWPHEPELSGGFVHGGYAEATQRTRKLGRGTLDVADHTRPHATAAAVFAPRSCAGLSRTMCCTSCSVKPLVRRLLMKVARPSSG